MGTAIRSLLIFSVFISLCLLLSAQSCQRYKFSGNKTFRYCNDLPFLNSSIHYNYNGTEATMEFAYRHMAMTTDTWVAWALNPFYTGMYGSQTYIAYQRSNGSIRVYTTSIGTDRVLLMPCDLTFRTWNISAIYTNKEMIIFGTLQLPDNKTTIHQVWQDGPVRDDNPAMHQVTAPHLMSKGTLDLLTGHSVVNMTAPDSARERKRNLHALLNVVGWGIMMPTGLMLGRYVKVIDTGDSAWFYIHSVWQTVAYIIGVIGWVIGMQLGATNRGNRDKTHMTLGIILFCLATIQVLALFLRPNKDHRYRCCWGIYHKLVGYTIVVISIVNAFKGFTLLSPSHQWTGEYFGSITMLFLLGVFLEVYSWNVIKKRNEMIEYSLRSNIKVGLNGYQGRNRYGML